MANSNKPFGFQPLRYRNGAPWNGMATPYYIPSTDSTNQYNIGDAVKTAAGGDANGICEVTKITNGTDAARGVIVGVLPVPPQSNSQQAVSLTLETENIPATKTKDYYVLVADDPNIVFALQDDGLSALTATSCNKNASYTVTNPSGLTPNSASVLTTASINTTQGLSLKLLGLVQVPNNAFGAYAQWQVIFNQHELGGPNTVGV